MAGYQRLDGGAADREEEMMEHLELAAAFAERSEEIGHQPTALLKAQLAQAHALIAIVEELQELNHWTRTKAERVYGKLT